MPKSPKGKKLSIDIVIIALVFLVLFIFFLVGRQANNNHKATVIKKQTASFNKSQYSTSNPNSIWVVVNKQRPLSPLYFQPANLVSADVITKLPSGSPPILLQSVAAVALRNLFNAAGASHFSLELTSGFISYGAQNAIYNSYSITGGVSAADKASTRPGYADSQVGLSVSIAPTSGNCLNQTCFANTPEGIWLAANAYKYGFIIRYPNGQQDITGYTFQPWYFRYVGNALANQIRLTNEPMEEFFNLGSAPTYQ